MVYNAVTQEEFEDILNLKGYKWSKVADSFAKENIYLVETEGVVIKVFSSIVSGVSRGVGADAIRVVGWDKVSNLPVSASEARVYRTEGWRDNLVLRIEGVKERMKGSQRCKICGGIMVERENKTTHQKFMGCLNYRNHPKKEDFGQKQSIIENKQTIENKEVKPVGTSDNKEEKPVGTVENKEIKPVGTVENKEIKPVGIVKDVGGVGGSATPESEGRKILDNFHQKMESLSGRLKINLCEVKGDEPLLETKLFQWGKYSFDKFNVIQSRVAEFVTQDCNVVIEARTSTGKTIMGELFMWKTLAEGKKVIYTSPLKALTREKWDSWTNKFGNLGYKIAIVTGDYRLTDKRIKELNEANIILCTSEMLDHRTRNMTSEKSEWLTKAGLIIIDEVQLIGMKERGDKLEAGLMRFAKINPNCRMVLLSGTMPNSGEIAGWINILNGKETILIKSTWRPIKLTMAYVQYNDKQGYYAAKDSLFAGIMSEVRKYGKEKILVFVHSKADGRRILGLLGEAGYKAEFHNADLEVDDRVNIEESFKSRSEESVRIIIATSTLAYGLNLPARIVLVAGMHRGLEEVWGLDIIQMAGRSGRLGIDTEGTAIILLPESHFEELKNKIEHPENIISQINNPWVAAFHVIGEIVGKTIQTREDVYKWYSRTLASRQNVSIDKEYVDELINYLLKNNAIRELDGKLVETELGKAAVYFYLRPDMLKDLVVNWTKIFDTGIENNDFMLTRALSRLNIYNEVIVSKADKEYIETYSKASKAMESTFGGSSDGQSKIGMAYLNMIKGVKSVEVKDGKKIPNPLSSVQRGLQQDVERLFQALAYIDAKYSRWGKGSYWSAMGLRLKYGVGPELVGLCMMEGIGGTYAKRLYDSGIRQPIELLTKKKEAITVLGARYDGIVEKNRKTFEIMGFKVENKTVPVTPPVSTVKESKIVHETSVPTTPVAESKPVVGTENKTMTSVATTQVGSVSESKPDDNKIMKKGEKIADENVIKFP